MHGCPPPRRSPGQGQGWAALAASAVLHVAAVLPLLHPLPRPVAEIAPAVAVELIVAAPPAPAPAPASAPAPPRPAAARAHPVRSSPAAKPLAVPPPADTATVDGAGTGIAAEAGTTPTTEAGNGGAGQDGGASAPGYTLGDSHTPAPDYPWSARRRGAEGRVVLRLEVDADGRPIEVELVHSSGHDALDQAALTAIRHWRLRPATADGVPVAGRVVVPIVFKLT